MTKRKPTRDTTPANPTAKVSAPTEEQLRAEPVREIEQLSETPDESMAKKKSPPMSKPVRAMFPKPAPINLGTGKVVFDKGVRKIVLTDIPSPEAVAFLSGETERRRTDLIGRLRTFTGLCNKLLKPYYGERPSCITEDQWRSIDQRMGSIRELPQSAPSEVHAALTAWRLLRLLVTDLDAEGEISDGIKRAICNAFDIGVFIQRCCAQIQHGENAALGRTVTLARTAENELTSQKAATRSELAKAEYEMRMSQQSDPSRMKTETLRKMAKVLDANGKPLYGSYGTLVRYSKSWK